MFRVFLSLVAWCLTTVCAAAQTWVQIEARPTEAQALERAADYAARLPDVEGYRLSSGWFAIVLGPYDEARAQATLLNLRLTRAVPSDSFIADGGNFRARIFGSDTAAAPALSPAAEVELRPAEETPAEARAAEAALDRPARELLQIALRYEGTYDAAIDGAFGPGTRRAMADWQALNGYEPTGILSTAQRRQLVDGYRAAQEALGIERVRDETTGIEIALPLGLMDFDRYDAPFAVWGAEGGPQAILISQIGDATTFQALYDILQTLEIVPLDGPRGLSGRGFTIEGRNARIATTVEARLSGDEIKGFALVWPEGDEKRRQLALNEMRATFTAVPGQVMPDAVSTEQSIDLLAGLDIRRADRVRSGFYVSEAGAVLTTTEAVEGCARVSWDDDVTGQVVATDADLGLALLRPEGDLAPQGVARLSGVEPRLQSPVAVAGFSFGGVLGAPSLTWGTFEDNRGLDGDDRLARLAVPGTESDAGGPVLDAGGGVAGLLLPATSGARVLPEGVALAVGAEAIAAFLGGAGLATGMGDSDDALDLAALQDRATAMTVKLSCWN